MRRCSLVILSHPARISGFNTSSRMEDSIYKTERVQCKHRIRIFSILWIFRASDSELQGMISNGEWDFSSIEPAKWSPYAQFTDIHGVIFRRNGFPFTLINSPLNWGPYFFESNMQPEIIIHSLRGLHIVCKHTACFRNDRFNLIRLNIKL